MRIRNAGTLNIRFVDIIYAFFVGLLAFLVIKGGRGLVYSSHSNFSLNPYGSALLAFMIGIFSDKVHAAMANVMDTLLKPVSSDRENKAKTASPVVSAIPSASIVSEPTNPPKPEPPLTTPTPSV